MFFPIFILANPGFPAASLPPERKASRFSHGTSPSLCGISLSDCPRGAARFSPYTDPGGIGSEERKGACQGTFSEFTHVTILNFAASGNSRSRKRSSAQFFRHQAGAAFQNHDSPGCENGLYTNVGSSSGSFSFTELTFLKMLTTGDCF